MTKQKYNIEEAFQQVQELVDAQEKALRTADTLLHLKDCIIEILEDQKKINEKENKILRICLYSLVALYSIIFIASYFAK
jgi:hypothetical protein